MIRLNGNLLGERIPALRHARSVAVQEVSLVDVGAHRAVLEEAVIVQRFTELLTDDPVEFSVIELIRKADVVENI